VGPRNVFAIESKTLQEGGQVKLKKAAALFQPKRFITIKLSELNSLIDFFGLFNSKIDLKVHMTYT
jgi:hypothetical protein